MALNEAMDNAADGTAAFEALAAAIRRNKFIPVPVADRNFVSPLSDDFLGQGIDQLRALVEAGLRPAHSVLDLGCGIGRTALPLTQYLSDQSIYFGLDTNLSGIAWCYENISTRYPNFEFAVINAHNPHYKHRAATGQESAAQAAWPIPPSRRFDFACAFSLFTHIVWDEVEHYLADVRFRMKARGRFYCTWFLIDDVAREHIAAGRAFRDFDVDGEGPTYFVKEFKRPAIAHSREAVLKLVERSGFSVLRSVDGGWRSNLHGGGQDVLLLQV